MKKYRILLVALAALAIAACEKNPADEPFKGTFTVSGTVEKGPFVQGSTINMQTMDEKLHSTGKTFMETIKDDAGSFDFGSQEFDTPYAKITATGYFFNEVTGALSQGMINLNALVDLSDKSSVNVNLLTHLKSQRIQKLIEEGKTFKEAASQAQEELMTAFGLQKYAGKDVSQFSITAGTDEAAALIAVSSIIQVGRSEASMTEFISKLTNEFGANGAFSDATKDTIAQSIKKLVNNLENISDNIVSRYEKLGRTVTVKDLRYFFDWDGDGTAGNEIYDGEDAVVPEQTQIHAPMEGDSYSVKVASKISYFISNESYLHSSNPYLNNGIVSFKASIEGEFVKIEVNRAAYAMLDSEAIILVDAFGKERAKIVVSQDGDPSVPLFREEVNSYIGSINELVRNPLFRAWYLEGFYVKQLPGQIISVPLTASDSNVYDLWSSCYRAISQIANFSKTEVGWMFAPYCNVLLADIYYKMTLLWGGVVVPDYNNPMNSKPRTEPTSIYEAFISVFKEMVERAPDEKFNHQYAYTADVMYKLPKDVIRVMLAKLYIETGAYADAVKMLEPIKNSGRYALAEKYQYPITAITDGREISDEDIFTISTNNTKSYGYYGVPVFTYTDALLLLVEAYYRTGNYNGATDLLKQVITFNEIPTDNFTFETNASAFPSDLATVRKRTFCNMGEFFGYLKRNGLGKMVLGYEDYQLLWPIPSQEIALNPYITQNPGY